MLVLVGYIFNRLTRWLRRFLSGIPRACPTVREMRPEPDAGRSGTKRTAATGRSVPPPGKFGVNHVQGFPGFSGDLFRGQPAFPHSLNFHPVPDGSKSIVGHVLTSKRPKKLGHTRSLTLCNLILMAACEKVKDKLQNIKKNI